MPKFDLKKKLNSVSKQAEKSIQKGVKAAKDFDVKETVSNAGKAVGNVADTVKNYDMKNMPGDLKTMAVNTGKAAERFVEDAKENSKDAKKALKELKKKEKEITVSLNEACYVFYLLMAIDGNITEEECTTLKDIVYNFNMSDEDYNKVIFIGNQIIQKAKEDGDYEEVIKEEAIDILKLEKKSDVNMSPKQFIWNLITLAYSDQKYSEVEKKYIRSIARVLNVDKAVISEMEFNCETLNKLMTDSGKDIYYKREANARREIIMNSVQLLIEDQEA